MSMHKFTDEEKQALWDEVIREFPDDDTMQQVHYVRLLHYHQTKNLTADEKIQFYASAEERKSA